jgi:hypothetical protein
MRSGVVAQLGERVVRNDEVRSSILLGSTNFLPVEVRLLFKNNSLDKIPPDEGGVLLHILLRVHS